MCRVTRDNRNEIVEVFAENGEPSQLYHSLLEIIPDSETALRQYADVLRYKDTWNEYELDKNGEPRLSEIQVTNDTPSFGQSQADPEKYRIFIDSFNRRKIKLDREMNVLAKELDSTNDMDRKIYIRRRIEQIKQDIQDIRGEITGVTGTKRLSPVTSFLKNDVIMLENLLGQNTEPTLHDLGMAKELIDFWKLMANYSVDSHPFYNDSELRSINANGSHKAILDNAMGHIQSFSKLLNNHYKNLVSRKTKDTYGVEHDINWDDFIKDISGVESLFLDISQTDNEVLHMLHEAVKKANWLAKQESNLIVQEIDDKIDKVRTWANANDTTLHKTFNSLRQTFSNEHSEQTGNMITLSTYNWTKELNRKREWASRQVNADNISKAEMSRFGSNGWETQYTRTVNAANAYANQQYKDELIELVGNEQIAEDYIAEADFLWDKYLNDRRDYATYLKTLSIPQDIVDFKMRKWEFQNSPEIHEEILTRGYINTLRKYDMASVSSGEQFSLTNQYADLPVVSGKYSVTIPNSAENIDQNFKMLYEPGNEPLLDLYKYTIDKISEINDYLPAYKTRNLLDNTMPFILETQVDEFLDHGMVHLAKSTHDRFLKSIREDNIDESNFRMRDPNGELSDEIQVRYIKGRKQIDDYIDLKVSQWVSANKNRKRDNDYKKEKREVRAAAEREVMNSIAEQQSFDIGQVLKAYAIFGLNYKHKAATEDLVRAVGHIVDKENVRPLHPDDNIEEVEGRLKKTKAMLRSYMDSFFNYRPKEDTFVHSRKEVLTPEEKEQRSDIDDLINQIETDVADFRSQIADDDLSPEDVAEIEDRIEDLESRKERLFDQRERIGGKFKSSSFIDKLLKFTRLKGMAWNVPAAFNNMAFGLVAGLNQAADGRVYGDDEYQQAFLIALNGVGKNYSFNKQIVPHKKDVADKLRLAMNELDILKETKYEIFSKSKEGTRSSWGKKIKFLDPYNPQARSEYFIQSIDLIATALATKVTLADGTETNLWKAMDNDLSIPNGAVISTSEGRADITISDEVSQADAMFYLKQRADKIIRENHGNYDPDSTIRAKRFMLGRMVSLFHTWLFEAVNQRYGRVRQDKQFGFTRKGRYRSGVKIPVLPIMLAFNEEGPIVNMEKSVYATKYLLNKLGQSLTLGKIDVAKLRTGETMSFNAAGFSEVDAANMRRNIRDAQFQLLLTALFFIMKGIADGEKEDREQKKIPARFKAGGEKKANYLANMSLRIYKELDLYSNPTQILAAPQNFSTMARTLGDFLHIIDALYATANGEGRYDAGPFKGKSKLWIRSLHAAPGASVYTSWVKSNDRIYGNPIGSSLGLRLQ